MTRRIIEKIIIYNIYLHVKKRCTIIIKRLRVYMNKIL